MSIHSSRRTLLVACCLLLSSEVFAAADAQPPRCNTLRSQLEGIDARLRHAHVNEVGERLKERRRQLQEQFWRLGCRR